MTHPLLTIITVTLNPGSLIERTFQSIAKHKNQAIEYLVLDGGSTDGTLSLIKRYARVIDYFHSQPDKGIYDAMNQATQLARGEYLLNINAGDELLALPLEQLKKISEQKAQLLCCGVITEQGKKLIPEWSSKLKYFNTLPHQGCFYHRDVFQHLQYDIQYKVFADYDLNQKLYLQRALVVTSPQIVSLHDMDGISNHPMHLKELKSIIQKNFGTPYLIYSWLHFKKEGLLKRLTCHY